MKLGEILNKVARQVVNIKSKAWQSCNSWGHLLKRLCFRGAQEMSWLARPNETVNKASNNQWALIFLGLACNIRVLTMARQHAIPTAIVHHHSSWQNGIKHNDATQMAMQSKCSCNKQQQQSIWQAAWTNNYSQIISNFWFSNKPLGFKHGSWQTSNKFSQHLNSIKQQTHNHHSICQCLLIKHPKAYHMASWIFRADVIRFKNSSRVVTAWFSTSHNVSSKNNKGMA